MSRNFLKRVRAIISLLISLLFVAGIFSSSLITNAQSGSWAAPTMISSDQATAWFPDITSDSSGRIHVVWAGGTVGYDTVLYTSTLDGRHWSNVNDIAALPQISANNSAATRPALWVDQTGQLNMSYVSGDLFYSKAPAPSAYSASAWETPIKMNGDQISYFSRILQDHHGVLHLFFTQNVVSINCTQCYHIFHRESADNGVSWSTLQDITADGSGSAKPQIISDKNDNLFAVWESGTGGGLGQLSDPTTVKFTASYDRGKTWSAVVTLAPASLGSTRDISLGLDKNGTLVTVWLAITNNKVYYQTSPDLGKTWSDPTPIDSISGSWNIYPGRLDDYTMASDSSGIVHLVVIGQLSNQKGGVAPTPTETPQAASTAVPPPLDLLHLTWNGQSWSDPDVITTYIGDVPEWPRINISNGNIANVVWFVRDQADIWVSDNAHYKIWYTRTQLAADPIPTVVIPDTSSSEIKIIPISTATISQSSIATDLLPTLAPSEKTESKVIYAENDYVSILAKSIIPSVLLILAISIFFLRRRR